MSVRAKYRVISVELYESPADSGRVKLAAGNDKEGDNTDWSKWTPSGTIEMYITNPTAFLFFKNAMHEGKRMYVDFNLVES